MMLRLSIAPDRPFPGSGPATLGRRAPSRSRSASTTSPIRLLGLLTLLLALAAPPVVKAQPGDEQAFQAQLEALGSRKFSDRKTAVQALADSRHPGTDRVLQWLLDGELKFSSTLNRPVRVLDDGNSLTDTLSGAAVSSADAGRLSRISVNNALRNAISSAQALRALSDPDPTARLQAVRALVDSPDQEAAQTLRELVVDEKVEEIRQTMHMAIAMVDIGSAQPERQLAAVNNLTGSLRPEARAAIASVLDNAPADSELARVARSALDSIETRVSLYKQIQNLFFGVSLGSVLLLAAIGLAITFGVMGVINMAHGEMVMLGAYTTYVIQQLLPGALEVSVLLALPVAFIVTALIGIALERGVIRYLYGRPLETLLATFGISLILQQAVRTIFSPLNRSVTTPDWMSGYLEINPVLTLTYNRLYIIAFSLLVLLVLVALLRYSRFGLHMRAVTQNRDMALCMGIRSARVDALTFGLGSGIAGL
ncbi:MAG: urea ABC transporter permease subunit UrtB, partial [Gammaproteobacteria bacterium]|nr:urea ABC transporter permease subunit UrtB [Gammaproteobacteria bacterium]